VTERSGARRAAPLWIGGEKSDSRHWSDARAALLRWWDANRRDLPWRRTRDPYRIWLSEVMLQQTRIEVVVPAYRRFLRALPTLARLARADEEEVLSLWSGLGYYSRARALHRAARELHARRQSFPRELAAARALPGVGAYTAAAVLSIAYGEPLAAVDGNVARVLARLLRCERPGEAEATSLLDRARPGDWNQAMMELGQTVCAPRRPACGECPLAAWCEARAAGEVARFPPARARRAPERVEVSLEVVRDRRGRVLLERGAFPYLRRMWLPLVRRVGAPRAATPARRPAGAGTAPGERRFEHAILHRRLAVTVASRTVSAREIAALLSRGEAERRLFSPGEVAAIGRSSLLTKALAHAA